MEINDVLVDHVLINIFPWGSCTLSPTGILLTGPEGVGKRAVVKAARRRLCLHYVEINCYDLIGDSVAATEARIRNVFQRGEPRLLSVIVMRCCDEFILHDLEYSSNKVHKPEIHQNL